MRIGHLGVTLCVCVAAAATDQRSCASDIVSGVIADLTLDRNDERMAEGLSFVKLSEHLPEHSIELLQQMGARSTTVSRLRSLSKDSRKLPEPATEPLSRTPEPSPAEREAMSQAMRRYAAAYISRLPDFICTREAHRIVGFGITNEAGFVVKSRWHDDGSYTSELTYTGGHEHYRLTRLNDKPTNLTLADLRRRVSEREFAGMMQEVFGSRPALVWDHWEALRGKRTAVFSYHVELPASKYIVCCPPTRSAHRGFVVGDPDTGAILRLIISSVGLTDQTPVNATGYVMDFAEVQIGSDKFLLPRWTGVYERSGRAEVREIIDYSNYRKFTADSAIAFPDQ
ncbi:MAG TPA: hypothetical protein VMJ34_00110 [Bryobacteraceae bacterium]|nr:hypothetical protein [Bryobacteraceae bacterium]